MKKDRIMLLGAIVVIAIFVNAGIGVAQVKPKTETLILDDQIRRRLPVPKEQLINVPDASLATELTVEVAGYDVEVTPFRGEWMEDYTIVAGHRGEVRKEDAFGTPYVWVDVRAVPAGERVERFRSLGSPLLNLDIYAETRDGKKSRIPISRIDAVVLVRIRARNPRTTLAFWTDRRKRKLWVSAEVVEQFKAIRRVEITNYKNEGGYHSFVVAAWPADDMEVDEY